MVLEACNYHQKALFSLFFILKSNLLEASPEMMQRDSEKEWYYGNKEKERLGPFSFKEVSDTTSILLFPCLSPCRCVNGCRRM